MKNLFQKIDFRSHSRQDLSWKIECDALTDEDWKTLAFIAGQKYYFDKVVGIPRGGSKFAKELEQYCDLIRGKNSILIVDDVLTTGSSMEKYKTKYETCENFVHGIVVFSRQKQEKLPYWISPLFCIT